ncbi:MAG: hypothetical protein KF745_00355 [Phycisphaeraceae bacterium]|nr:hypothetical protein [Phycisphaeraceae bacterium]
MTAPPGRPRRLDRFDLYELCAQAPDQEARFLHAVHGARPRVLRDDFAGPGAVARAWTRIVPRAGAIAVDLDPEPMAKCRASPGVECLRADATRTRRRADVIAAFNFALCELSDRAALLRYLKNARASLTPRGVFACDLYGGAEAYTPGSYTRRLRGPAGERIEYTWTQRSADILTARVVNTMTFRLRDPGSTRDRVLKDAFTYRWRLWTMAEVREAMAEAGFPSTEVYDRYADAIDSRGGMIVRPVSSGPELGDNWVVYIVARAPARPRVARA